MAAAISFAVGGIVNQTRGTVNATVLVLVYPGLLFFSSPSLLFGPYIAYICIYLCTYAGVLAQVRGMHDGVIKRKRCEENEKEGKKGGWNGCLYELVSRV